jgi:hypothetical protein
VDVKSSTEPDNNGTGAESGDGSSSANNNGTPATGDINALPSLILAALAALAGIGCLTWFIGKIFLTKLCITVKLK